MRGSIRRRGIGWEYRITFSDPETGKRKEKSKSGFKTKKEAEKELAVTITKLEKGEFFEAEKMVLRDYLQYWLKTYASVNVANSTYDRYTSFTDTIIKNMGNIQLKVLKPAHIQEFYSSLVAEKRLSNSTILKIHRMLHIALKHAVQWQMILNNPSDAVTAPKPDKKEMSVWTPETAFKFLEEIRDTEIFIPVMLAFTTGMREGEIAALRWKRNVNLKEGYISVTHNFQRSGSKYILKEPKTDKSKRRITLMQLTISELEKHQKLQNQSTVKNINSDDDFVCAWEDRRPFRPHYISDRFRYFVEKLNYPKIRFHDLRHSHATWLLSMEVNSKVISERLGHSTTNITDDIYSHVLPNIQKQAVEKLDKMVSQK